MALDPQSLFRKFSLGRAPRRTAGRGRQGALSLGFETLEARQMMAADMAEIVGTVRLDVNGDSSTVGDPAVASAQVALYRDNGNGVWDVNDASVGVAVSTDSFGKYRFESVGAGKYFVKLTLPATLQSKAGEGVQEINITAAESDGVVGPTIDGFTTGQIAEATPPLPSSHMSTQLDAAVMGGERDLFVELTDGTDIYSSVSLISGGGLLRLASDTTVSGNAKIVWDGQDGDAAGVDPTGLGGLDFTTFQGNTLTGITLRVGADHPDCVVKLRVYTSASQWTEFTTTVPETAGGAATKHVTFNFSDAATDGSGGGADFANVGAIELTFMGVSAVDGQVSLVGLTGLTTKTADFAAYNKLSLGDRVWNDANNDGMLGAGEQGISGVKLNLYNDVDQNNQFTPGVDTNAGTTTTNATGHYQFTDLLPGQYVVQVDAPNFQSGMALAGMASSKGAAADPDDNVDGDDNGAPVAGHGVASQAISLLASDDTVDFGFFGFDLVLDKAVQQHAVSPNETVTYTVRIVNDGPSIASGVEFVDNLPAGVTYKSLSVDKGGVNLQHANGTITGSLGNMAAGDVIIVTILVDVKPTATGILRNEAEVSAPDEEYTLNNRDEVENPVTPKIDLAIDKTDSQDPVQQGATFQYTLVVTNHGPSHATGVTVVDNLPANVTYQGATRAPASVAGDTVTFNVGDLAAGASTTIEITVAVDAGFVGTLLNHTEVWANETEITYANNEDTEPTVVAANPASIGGHVYVDRNNNGVYDPGETPLANVLITITGNDMTGANVTRSMITGANGAYQFNDLMAGTYIVTQDIQPTRYKDGKDAVGLTFDASGTMQPANGFQAPDLNADDNRDSDAFEGIMLNGGFAAKDYNFGELAVTVTKRDFIRPLFYR